jgi:hypothetical protein
MEVSHMTRFIPAALAAFSFLSTTAVMVAPWAWH